ncbi:MAG: 6-pyruvoyl trahydropterin synthase family protein [Bacteroidia bacterium]
MRRVRVTKEFSFEMAHALKHHDGACKNIHGHSYQLSVTVLGSPLDDKESPKQGMVLDFSVLKELVNEKIIHRLDHALVLNKEDAGDLFTGPTPFYGKLVLVSFQPTCENLLLEFAENLRECLPEKVMLVSMCLRETPTSYSEWFAKDNEAPGLA